MMIALHKNTRTVLAIRAATATSNESATVLRCDGADDLQVEEAR